MEHCMNDLWRLSATDLSALIRDRKVSAKEATVAGLARLDAVNPAINAVVDHRPNEALARADAVDAAIARGDDVGPLGGVPITVKVNIDYATYPTSNGVKIQNEIIAKTNSPVIDNLLKAGAVIIGRTNCPAFSYRWFTTNQLYGDTKNPRDPSLTPGGSSGGAGSAVAAGIGHIAHGTDIAGSIRYPAYACGVHGLRPTVGRIAAYNQALPERIISGQITAVSGPLARTINDVRLGLAAMSQPDARDPWWVPAPLEGPTREKRVAMCLRPDGLAITADVEAAVRDAGKRLERAGWVVEEVENTPALREAAALQTQLWFGDGYQGMLDAAEREGDPAALVCLRGQKDKLKDFENGGLSRALVRRSTFVRDWEMFLQRYAVVLMPMSGELPFPDHLDMQGQEGFDRVWAAQMPQIGIPFMGLPALSVATGLVGRAPTGVQVVAGRYREDLCLLAGEAIEAGGTPPMPCDPVTA
jgi:amidase